MPSDWNCLWRRKRGHKKTDKFHGHLERSYPRFESAQPSFYEQRNRGKTNPHDIYYTGQQKYVSNDKRTDFSFTPDTTRQARTDVMNGRNFDRQENDSTNRQSVPKSRHWSENFVQNPDGRLVLYPSEPLKNRRFSSAYDHSNYTRDLDTEMGHNNMPSYQQTNRHLSPLNDYSNGYTEMNRTSPKTGPHFSRNDSRGQNFSQFSRMDHPQGFSRKTQSLDNTYPFGNPVVRRNTPDVNIRPDRFRRKLQHTGGSDVMSMYVPLAVSTQDVSALLFGENTEEPSISAQKNSVLELQSNTKISDQQQNSSFFQNTPTNGRDELVNHRDLKNNFKERLYPSLSKMNSRISPIEHKSEQNKIVLSSVTRSQNLKSLDEDKTVNLARNVLEPGSNPTPQSTNINILTANTDYSNRDHLWSADSKLNRRYMFRAISMNSDSVDNADYNDDISDEEVANVLSQLDNVTKNNPERQAIKVLEGMFAEGEVLY